jgi:hypothetical protein
MGPISSQPPMAHPAAIATPNTSVPIRTMMLIRVTRLRQLVRVGCATVACSIL